MPGQDNLWPWLQSILANQGAGQPTGMGGTPRYGTGPGDLGMGDPRGLTGMPGPSMGYPALGALGAQPQPQPQPPAPDALGSSVGINPPGDSAGDDGGNNIYQAAAAAPAMAMMPPRTPTPQTYPHMPWPGSPAPQTYPHMPWPDTGAPAGSPSATSKPANSGTGKGPLASSSASAAAPMKRTAGAPNLGYYQQNPRFGTVQYQTPNSVGNRAPIYTALNLGGLFGGGGQPAAANPANVPAANATPVSSAAAPSARQAPDMTGISFDENGNPVPAYGDLQSWGYGPLQQGSFFPRTRARYG